MHKRSILDCNGGLERLGLAGTKKNYLGSAAQTGWERGNQANTNDPTNESGVKERERHRKCRRRAPCGSNNLYTLDWQLYDIDKKWVPPRIGKISSLRMVYHTADVFRIRSRSWDSWPMGDWSSTRVSFQAPPPNSPQA